MGFIQATNIFGGHFLVEIQEHKTSEIPLKIWFLDVNRLSSFCKSYTSDLFGWQKTSIRHFATRLYSFIQISLSEVLLLDEPYRTWRKKPIYQPFTMLTN